MTDLTLWSLFLSAFLSSTLLPGGSEAVLAYLTQVQGDRLWLLLAVASVGNTLGGMTSWLVGRIIAIRYPAEQVILPKRQSTGASDMLWEGLSAATSRTPAGSPMKSPPTKQSDEGRVTRDEEKQNQLGAPVGRVRGTHPGEAMGERGLPRHSSLVPRPSAKAVERLRRWGTPVLLLSWLPVIGDPLCVAAGWLRVHWLLSLILIGIGKTARYAVVVLVFM
ncbi:MAG: YqaA family protein [Pseudomonadota bacterium]|nr:YqaA family protein [Pseudomonadota bacterium]